MEQVKHFSNVYIKVVPIGDIYTEGADKIL